MSREVDEPVSVSREQPARPAITAEERSRRESACRAARASVVLEGFKPSQEEEDRAQRFINGEIELDEYVGGHPSVNDTPCGS